LGFHSKKELIHPSPHPQKPKQNIIEQTQNKGVATLKEAKQQNIAAPPED